MADPEETPALRRDAAGVAAEATSLLLQLRGILAAAGVPVPPELEGKWLAWVSRHVPKS